ncbi:hypothetical protein AWM70_07410 [Paenibacillus yonginensis]|uniref:VWFA domain-containing protein n=1 Tax=Paenibacillus yonginensis TaxID=1462996 RepID=A0A1B1MZ41_9BACL|nr:VWA domain-containing protein [Paenibacillus yonginensis]ANS74428.1 hypothetical protein AWM70_07410 [Paenibacillus yonginensis]
MSLQPFPFPAMTGGEKQGTALALMLHLLHPGLGGVLLSGPKGTGKSTWLNGLRELVPHLRTTVIPVGVTEDRLLGGLDWGGLNGAAGEAAGDSAGIKFREGLLAESDNGLLLVDQINRLPAELLYPLMEGAKSKRLQLEREGVSREMPCSFRLFAAMDPEEGELSPGILDGFGLCLFIPNDFDVQNRLEISSRRLAFEEDPASFIDQYSEQMKQLRQRLERASALLPSVTAQPKVLLLAAEVAHEAGCDGQRGEYFLIESARALAAWENRTSVTEADIAGVARWVLPHRMKERPEQAHPRETEGSGESGQAPEEDQEFNAGSPSSNAGSSLQGHEPREEQNPFEASLSSDEQLSEPSSDKPDREKIHEIGRSLAEEALKIQVNAALNKTQAKQGGGGKRQLVRSINQRGRYRAAALPKGKITDLALDATLRAAAPFQRIRTGKQTAFQLEARDFRQKVRYARSGTVILFAVDASGSMSARKRMEAVKGAIYTLLNEAYVQRDRIGMLAFRKNEAELVLPFTRSVEFAVKQLRELPTGGRTPLGHALRSTWDMVQKHGLLNQGQAPVVVWLTDGKANQGTVPGMSIAEITEECHRLASRFRQAGMHTLVLDTEQGYLRLGQARKLAEVMGASYYKLEQLQDSEVVNAVRHILH